MNKSSRTFLRLFITVFSLGGMLQLAHAEVTGIVAFGDSLTDNGNVSNLIGQLIPKSILTIPNPKAYYEGRFSNGPIWAEVAANDLGVPLEDKAVGDAQSYKDALPVPLLYASGLVPSLIHQTELYINEQNGSVDPNKIYTLWIGGNDYMHAYEQDPSKVIDAIMESMTNLYSAGAKNFIVMNLPDFSISPLVLENGTDWDPQVLKYILNEHNAELATRLAEFRNSTGLASVELYDVDGTFKAFKQYPSNYGFTNISERCYEGGFVFRNGDPIHTGESVIRAIEKELTLSPRLRYSNTVCPNPNSYLFWDAVHPTASAHSIFGHLISQFIRENF